jgi:gliding motility-associated lipoprotein GldH
MSEYTLPLLYLERIPLSAGEYTIGIQQGMREESLLGITSVGLKFLKL